MNRPPGAASCVPVSRSVAPTRVRLPAGFLLGRPGRFDAAQRLTRLGSKCARARRRCGGLNGLALGHPTRLRDRRRARVAVAPKAPKIGLLQTAQRTTDVLLAPGRTGLPDDPYLFLSASVSARLCSLASNSMAPGSNSALSGCERRSLFRPCDVCWTGGTAVTRHRLQMLHAGQAGPQGARTASDRVSQLVARI